jgi:signal transduction histidine kinase
MGQSAVSEMPRFKTMGYLFAVLITAVATVIRFSLFGVLADDEPYMTFVVAVMVAAAYGGLGPGLLATILSALAGLYFFVQPYFSFRIEGDSEPLACSLFLVTGVTISVICEALHQVRRRLQIEHAQLVEEVQVRLRAEQAARESEARLMDADRHKNEFLAMLAHELRNPLAPIRNALGVLRLRGADEPDLRWGREIIERQVDCLTRLIDDLLDVSRVSRGKLELRKQPLDLAALLQGAVESCRPFIDQHGHQLEVALPAEPMTVEGDMVRLAQVFMNLLNNAAKYTEQGGRIWLSAERHGGDVVARVRDTGIGISADKLPHLFDMFYQVDQARQRSEGGLGIGLTLVRRLVEMHGGTVEARSEGTGKGSEFLVRLPAGQAQAPRGPELDIGEDRRAPTADRFRESGPLTHSPGLLVDITAEVI